MRRFVVFGRVQGVGFRAFVLRTAQTLGLGGWVRNRWDGSVEVLACGAPEQLSAFERALAVGPRMALVDRIESREEPDSDASPGGGFTVLRDSR